MDREELFNIFVKKLFPVHFSGDCWLHGTSYKLPIVLKLRFRALILQSIYQSMTIQFVCLRTLTGEKKYVFTWAVKVYKQRYRDAKIKTFWRELQFVMFCYWHFNHLVFQPSWNSFITRSIPRLLASWFDKNPSSSGSAERSTRQSSPTVLHWQILHA